MFVTDAGMWMLVSDVQPENMRSDMLVIPSGRTMLSVDEQPENAPSAIEVTLDGILIALRLWQSAKA
jgi:hypothetical protein